MINLEYLEKIKDKNYRKLLAEKAKRGVFLDRKEREMIALEIIAEEACLIRGILEEKFQIYRMGNP